MKSRPVYQVFLPVLLMAVAAVAEAHPGHEHSHWSSPLVHALFYLAIVAAAGAGVYLLRRRASSRKLAKKGDRNQ